ncbi:MAG: DUF5663 domain-containing protein [Patescibacteria group bacterium]
MTDNLPNNQSSTNRANPVGLYLDSALTQAGAKGLSSEQLVLLRNELLVEIEKRLRLVSLESLDDRGLQDYTELIRQGKADLASQVEFFKSQIPDYEQLLQKTLQDITAEFIANAKAI